jgi:hypothetical protein
VSGGYSLSTAPDADFSCSDEVVDVVVAQAGCTVTVTGIFPGPISFAIDVTGAGTYAYAIDGSSGTLRFDFDAPVSFRVTDTGALAACPGMGIRVSP